MIRLCFIWKIILGDPQIVESHRSFRGRRGIAINCRILFKVETKPDSTQINNCLLDAEGLAKRSWLLQNSDKHQFLLL